jgi:hypothetical protein
VILWKLYPDKSCSTFLLQNFYEEESYMKSLSRETCTFNMFNLTISLIEVRVFLIGK